MKIGFIRHGQTHLNLSDRLQGISDPPLDPIGRQAVIASVARLPQQTYTSVYCSRLCRARQTAELIAEHLAVSIIIDDRLTERNLGDYEGLARAEVLQQMQALGEGIAANSRPPRGESIEDVTPRAHAFLSDIVEMARPAVVVVHGAWMKALAMTATLRLPALANGELLEVDINQLDQESHRPAPIV